MKNLRPGQRVLSVGNAGKWQHYRTVDKAWCVPVARCAGDIAAATAFVNLVLAWLMLFEEGRLCPGKKVFINAAGSSIGCMLLRLPAARWQMFERVLTMVAEGIARTDHWQTHPFETLPERLRKTARGDAPGKRILMFD